MTIQPQFVVHGDAYIGAFPVRRDGTRVGLVRAFGRPTTLRHTVTGCRARWPQLGMRVDLYNLGRGDRCKFFRKAVLTGRRWQTAKGLRIGDSLARARELFPRARRHGVWMWLIPRFYSVGDRHYAGLAAKLALDRVVAFRVEYPSGGD
jgi:hypothetical protein